MASDVSCTPGSCAPVEGHASSTLSTRLLQKTVQLHRDQKLNWTSRDSVGDQRDTHTAINVCIKGHLVPELFIIGAQKGGTTSLAAELGDHSNIKSWIPWAGDYGFMKKEQHIFDIEQRWNRGMDKWLEQHPTCVADARVVALDATPAYLYVPEAPARMRERYIGADQWKRLKMVILLKEPLARTQSAFYMYKQNPVIHRACQSGVNRTFQEYIAKMISADGEQMGCRELYDQSFYSHQIARFFQHFHPDQFIIAPSKFLQNDASLADYLIKHLGLPQGQLKALHSHVGSHPSLEEDLPLQLREQAQVFLNNHTGAHLVGQVLVGKNGRSPHLFGFNGNKSSASEIAAWLSQNW